MRRGAAIALVVATAAFAVAAAAWAAPAAITGDAANTFVGGPSYSHDAGTVAQFNVTGGTHNVTSNGSNATGPDGGSLFRSATVSGGTVPVQGTQYLPAGAYSFFCTIHPGTMQAVLDVTGTPLPRPIVAVKVLDKKLSKVSKRGKLRVKVTLTGGQPADINARIGRKPLASGRTGTGPSQVLKLRISKSRRAKLAKKRKAKIRVTAAVAFGSPVTATAKLK